MHKGHRCTARYLGIFKEALGLAPIHPAADKFNDLDIKPAGNKAQQR
ncbi:hypothetical protein SDC9_128987 [bioreactor metagenome]|uniref:Uncharacterized protein n=1 Tax=bioreactor metagenome TaxID=1076179 RepID=A0A645CYC8_9ZZZZ